MQLDDELNLHDLGRVLLYRKRWVLSMPIVAILTAILWVSAVRSEWQASVLLQIGQVGGGFVEPPSLTLVRLKLPGFQQGVFASLKLPGDQNAANKLYRESFRAEIVPNTDTIKVWVRGYSREQARQLADATISRLQRVHEDLAASAVDRLRRQLARVNAELDQIRLRREKLAQLADHTQGCNISKEFIGCIVLENVLALRDAEFHKLEQLKSSYEDQLSPRHTYPTSPIESVYVGEQPLAPNKLLIVILAGMSGLIAGVIVAVVLGGPPRLSET